MNHSRAIRSRRRRWSRRGERIVFEAVERRVLLCALHEDHGHDVSISFWDGPSDPAPTELHVSTPPDMVGPPANLLPGGVTSALFNPITTWDTLANGMPILNSLPGAPTSIFLDFDGDTGSNSQAYSEDTDLTTFNPTEQANIVEAWRQIADYFSMFDTNVTTILPSTPKAWEIIGNNAGGSTGGYAYVNTFPNSSPQAFNASSNARTRESGMAHELGHVFGLQHQSVYDAMGIKTAEYMSAPDTLHGPIMGVDYSGSVHKWFIGHPSTSVSAIQDDISVIANKIKAREPAGGDGFRADDFGNTIATAAPLNDNGTGLQYISGIIERRLDVDAFSFVAGDGAFAIAAVPDAPSGLDAKLEIYDSSGNLLAAKDGATNDQRMILSLPAGTYCALVSSHGDYGDVGMYDLSVRDLPAGWTAADIGTTGLAGYSEFDPTTSTFTNAGAGSAVSGTADSFRFVYQTLNGDGEIVARVTQNQNTNSAAKVGVEIRDGLANNARHVAMIATPSAGTQFISRGTVGGSATVINGASGGSLPLWVRLVRAGNTFTGYMSVDGETWSQVSQATVSMNSSVSIGLLTSSLTTSKLDVGTVDHVAITGDTSIAPPVYNSLPAPTGLSVVPAASGVGLNLSWDDVPDSTGFNVQRSSDGITYTQIATTAAGVTTYSDANPGPWMRYFYRVAARDATGASPPSPPVSFVGRPSAPAVSITAYSTTALVVNWKDVSGDIGYRIERSTDGGVTFNTIGTVGVNVPAFNDAGLALGTSYTYRVTALSAAGDSTPSTTVVGATRLNAVGGIGFDSIASNSISFHWNDLSNETGYRIERSTDGTTFSTLINLGQNVTSYSDTSVTPLKEYYYRVLGTLNQSVSLYPTVIFAGTPGATPLPVPWTSADIGSNAGRGASGYSSGTFTLISSGADIGGTSDGFRYTSQPLVGDGQIVARVAAIDNTDANAKSGVMIRAGAAANAQFAAVVVTPGAGVNMLSRATTGAVAANNGGLASAKAPYWVKIVRSGNSFTGYYSADGATWTQISQVTIAMGTSATIGLASASRTTTTLSTSTVTNVTVSNSAPTVATPAAANPNPINSGNTATLSVLGADDHGESNLTYSWAVTATPAGAPAPIFSANNSNAAKLSGVTFYQLGDYEFTVTITDLSGQSVTSSVSVTVNTVFPAVIASSFDFHNHLSFTFNEDVSASLTVDDLIVQPQLSGAAISPVSVSWDAPGNVATFTFAGDFADGNYRATLSAAGITDGTNLHPAANFNFDFYALAGDINGDRTVNFDDLVILSQNYGRPERTRADGDLNGDGSVDFNDLVMLAQDYNSTLPSPATPVSPPLTTVFSTTPISVLNASAAPDMRRKVQKPMHRAFNSK